MSDGNPVWESQPAWRGKLRFLVKDLGVATVAEGLGLEDNVVHSLLAGEVEMEEDTAEGLAFLCDSLGVAVGAAEDIESLMDGDGDDDGDDIRGLLSAAVEDGPVVEDGVVGRIVAADLDGDGVMDVELPGVGIVVPGSRWSEEMEHRRIALRTARAVAVMSQFQLGMSYQDHVAAVGLVVQIELALISFFMESVPDPGVVWDSERRNREMERRLRRLRWVEREQEQEYGGFKGVWNRLVGRRRISGKELYQRMLREADGMLEAMGSGDRGEEVMEEVMRYTGVDYSSRSGSG